MSNDNGKSKLWEDILKQDSDVFKPSNYELVDDYHTRQPNIKVFTHYVDPNIIDNTTLSFAEEQELLLVQSQCEDGKGAILAALKESGNVIDALVKILYPHPLE